MEIKLEEHNGITLAIIESNEIFLKNEQDAVDLIGNCGYNGAQKIIVFSENLAPGFFDLKTRIAGEMLQKFSTYRAQLAIIGDFRHIQSKSLSDFMYESNKAGRIYFVNSTQEAVQRLTSA